MIRRLCIVIAVGIALLPVPVIWYRLGPSYGQQGKFLAFVTSLSALLVMGYLLYIRDLVARVMFRDILDPLPKLEPYHRQSRRDAARRRLDSVRHAGFALLPPVLILASVMCSVAYRDRLDDSVVLASGTASQFVSRDDVLQSRSVDEIPLFGELTTLFVLCFVGPVAGLTLQAIRGYGLEAISGLQRSSL